MAYSKQTWVRGEKVASAKLNHMEDGIDAISADGAIDTANLAPAAVTNAKLDQEAVDSNNIRNGAITTPLIYDGVVTLPKLGADVIAELDNKADIDGSYESMTVGNAEQLVSTVGVEDSAPYTFRTTGGSADVGDRMNLKKVIGGTVAWNQLAVAPNIYTPTGAGKTFSNGVITLTANSQGASNNRVRISTSDSDVVSPIGSHKYLVSVMIKPSISGTYASVYFGNSLTLTVTNLTSGAWNTICGIKTAVNPAGRYLQIDVVGTGTAITDGDTVEIKNYQLSDLTAMFGSTIADYVYTLESGTAGAGIAWLKKYGWFTKPYYPYKAAALESVKTSAHRTIGFNQWDEEWEEGILNSSGAAADGSNAIRSKNYCRCVPSTVYYVRSSKTDGGSQNRYYVKIAWYDADKNFISGSWENNRTITSPDNAAYFKICTNTSTVVYGGTYNHDICINISWDGERDGEYAPFEQHTYALDDVELRGVPKLDASNNLYYDGDRYLPDGTVERRYAERAYQSGDESLADAITDGTNTVYKLATPTTDTAEPYTELQICDDFGTEEFVDAATRDFDMPVGHNTVYQPNLRAKLEMSPNSPDGDGDYLVRQTNGVNEYVLFSEVKELPDLPTTDGNYKLRCTVSDGTATLSWVSDT